jgi:hypothetical protein
MVCPIHMKPIRATPGKEEAAMRSSTTVVGDFNPNDEINRLDKTSD